jgi:hypothetical protein
VVTYFYDTVPGLAEQEIPRGSSTGHPIVNLHIRQLFTRVKWVTTSTHPTRKKDPYPGSYQKLRNWVFAVKPGVVVTRYRCSYGRGLACQIFGFPELLALLYVCMSSLFYMERVEPD